MKRAGLPRETMLLLLTALFWGAAFPLTRYTVLAMAPLTAALLRYGMAGAGFAAAMERTGQLRTGVTGRRLWIWSVVGFFGIFLNNALFFLGMRLATAAEGAVIIPLLNPVLGAAMGALFLRERLNRRFLAGGGLAMAGTALVVLGGAGRGGFHYAGDLLFVGACLAWGAYGVTAKLAMSAGDSALRLTGWSDLLGAAMFVPLIALFGGGGAAPGPWWDAPLGVWLALAAMAIFPTILSFTWWNEGVRVLGVSRASVFIYLVPVSGLLISALWLGESLLPLQWAGAALALVGVALSQRK
jgi:drug/metabolite transporter (DMT)-like permease